jgi:hypothetical protein
MTEFKENIINFPKEINALISIYLEDDEGDYFRDQAEDFIIKEIRGNKTYGNGVLHSFNDMPAIIWRDVFNKVGTQYWFQSKLI